MSDLVSLWKDPKYKNIIKLILWAIFILFVVCLCIVSNKNQIKNNNKEESRLEFKHKIHNLANKKLKVYYKIDDVKYYLSFKDNGGYSVRIINNNKEDILNYEVM